MEKILMEKILTERDITLLEGYLMKIKQEIILDINIFNPLGLSGRPLNVLRSLGCNTFRDVVSLQYRDIWKTKGVGRETMKEIEEALRTYGLRLGS